MEEQQLLTDLAIAEKNMRSKLKFGRPEFADELTDAFREYHVESFLDLVRADMHKAIELRQLAVKEELLYIGLYH